jgi:hypothetical protein
VYPFLNDFFSEAQSDSREKPSENRFIKSKIMNHNCISGFKLILIYLPNSLKHHMDIFEFKKKETEMILDAYLSLKKTSYHSTFKLLVNHLHSQYFKKPHYHHKVA